MKIIQSLLEKSEFTRPGIPRKSTKALIVHWVANPGQTAEGVIKYWNDRRGSWGSGHAVIDHDGTIYQTLQWDEVGYHVGSSKGYTDLATEIFGARRTSSKSSPNHSCIGIELCHTNWEGEHTEECLRSAEELLAHLCKIYQLDPFSRILTHQMVVGWKDCPKWFVNHPEDFELLRLRVERLI